jgi:peptidoglycan/LPS O-acetylase OafA/YrhL
MEVKHWWPFLDLARCTAALLVVVSHLRAFLFPDFHAATQLGIMWRPFYFITGFGHEAVMIFFVLSGFLVGGGVTSRVADDQWSWGDYAVTRLTRLWIVLAPALVLTALWDHLGIALTGSLFYSGGLFSQYGSGPLPDPAQFSPTTFLGNLAFLQTILVPTFGSNGPLWSLANEFWYYAIFPLAFCAVAQHAPARRRLGNGALAVLLCCILPTSMLLYGLIWLLGVIAFALHQRFELGSGYRNLVLAVSAAALAATLTLSRVAVLRGFSADLAIGAAFAAMLLPLAQMRHLTAIVATPARIGADFSYTLYLVHFPFAAFLASWALGNRLQTPDFAGAVLWIGSLGLIVLYAYAVYFIFESNTRVVRRAILRIAGRFFAGKMPGPGIAEPK